jgi:CheY-like chemotaxis protein
MLDISQLKILIVDDHLLAQQIVMQAMHDMSITQVAAVADGYAACDALHEAYEEGACFDVVFLDQNIPHPNGLEVLQRFRMLRAFDETVFIMLTAASEHEDVQKAFDAGANGYLIKPVIKQAICQSLEEASIWLQQQRKSKA